MPLPLPLSHAQSKNCVFKRVFVTNYDTTSAPAPASCRAIKSVTGTKSSDWRWRQPAPTTLAITCSGVVAIVKIRNNDKIIQ